MISKEAKKLVELSGGKVIISEGDVESSFVLMKMGDYLAELENLKAKKGEIVKKDTVAKVKQEKGDFPDGKGLTNEELLDRINTDIAELSNRKLQDDIESFESEKDDIKYHYESVH